MAQIIKIHTQTDEELIDRYKNGDEVISELYSRYNNLVFGSCLKYFKNKVDADDAVSEIFALISRKLKTHKVENFKSWLYTVTRNYCIEVLRKKSRLRDKKLEADVVYSERVFHPDEVEDQELIKKLQQCIEALPPKQRETVEKFYFQKVSYKEIANQMDLSWDKIRSFMQNGRRNLKNCLENK